MDAGPRPPSSSPAAKLLLAVLAAAAALLLVEGLAALATGHALLTPALRRLLGGDTAAEGTAGGLFPRLLEQAPPRAAPPPDESGLYASHPDPLVGYTLRPEAELSILGGSIRSDALGLRRTPGPPPPAGALRLVVLGDSVAFGFGLHDSEALAARLQVLLAETRGPAGRARPVACRTVAVPGWNHRNAVRFLFDHWDALAPDIVVYLPIANDLMDTDGVTERHLRRAVPDIAQRDPWLSVYQGLGLAWLKPALKQVLSGDAQAIEELLGPNALDADISPESQRRYDDNAASIVRLDERLAQHGGHLLLAPYVESNYHWRLQGRLLDAAPGVPWLPLFSGIPPAFMLPSDPHPNARTVDAMAHWIAADLLSRGWVPRGNGPPLPDVEAEFGTRRAARRAPAEVRAACTELRARALAALRDVVDWRSADGLAQVLGGLNADGSIGARLAVLLGRVPGGAATLDIELAPLPARPDLYPLRVAVEADGVPIGTLSVAAEGSTRARLPLPPAETASAAAGALLPVEVRLLPERWVVAPVRGEPAVVSCLPLRLASAPD